ncbi:hypothetical protein BU24DRAFT_8335 [Aaosphaeria arxii CBS 175.79]|uniref:Uncharacterized protein n=1 Tax=Aaosphaeria arxii CBS 175.79 TaxID=1450172 RepID=A0A6A5Y7R2_9PLEO|nr:uncharacterized protein BU24DRAFT_8335 [Aaosphaeria arxii CBS 175.79]KAF2020781.1 hypothetical protein BU24DRAFT_8335 [Aaosphaeria arxii CBS 175.79]
MSRTASSSIAPAVPVVPAMPIRPVTPTKSKKEKQAKDAILSSNQNTPRTPEMNSKPATPIKSERKPPAAKAQATKTMAKNKSESTSSAIIEGNQVSTPEPASKSKTDKSNKKANVTPKPEMTTPQEVKAIATAVKTPSSSKRQHPGKLDISAATQASDADSTPFSSAVKLDSNSKSLRASSLSNSGSVSESPAATSTGSPIKRATAPRTLRVLPTPKTENVVPLSAISTASVPHVPNVDKLRSRQASVASINPPGTPVSDMISDIASVTSTSVSRANSPPPIGGKVGTAPVRKKTKSQAKKDRQEKARHMLEEEVLAVEEQAKLEAEPVQAPIVGRKKKTKKPTVTSAKPVQNAGKSRPTSPKPKNVEEREEEKPEVKPVAASPVKATPAPTAAAPVPQPPPMQEPASPGEHIKDKRELNPHSIFADLEKNGELLTSSLEFFKPLSASLSHSARTTQPSYTTTPPNLKLHFSDADMDALANKRPVRLTGQDGKSESRTLITPQGKFFWGLTQELEEKALELEKNIEELKGAARFYPRKHSAHSPNHSGVAQAQSQDVLPAIATALKEAGAKLSKSNSEANSDHQIPKLDATSTLLGSTSLPLPPVHASSDGWSDLDNPMNKSLDLSGLASVPAPQPQQQTPADAIAYLNQFVLPKTDNPSPNVVRTEMAAVGGPPGSGVGSMPANVNKIAKAAKVVADSNIASNDLSGMGAIAADLLGGVVVQGLEALVGAGLGFHSSQDLSVDAQGNVTLGGSGLDVQGLVDAIGSGSGIGGFGTANNGRRGRRSVLSIDEAEQAMLAAKKDHEALEKKLIMLMRRNKKMVSSMGKA